MAVLALAEVEERGLRHLKKLFVNFLQLCRQQKVKKRPDTAAVRTVFKKLFVLPPGDVGMLKRVSDIIKLIAKSKKRLATAASGLVQPLSVSDVKKLFVVLPGQLNGLDGLTVLVG